MNLKFDKEHWIQDKTYFNDIVDINVELMDKVKQYFFGFTDAPIDLYNNKTVEAKIDNFNNEDELISYLKEKYNTGAKMVLYCILTDSKNGMIILRSAIL